MKKFLKEFEKFAVKGNVVDLAVAVVVGGAFGKIVTSLVADIIMPIFGVAIGGINFANLSVKIGKSNLLYGNFLQAVVDFLIIAFCIFIVIKAMNVLTKKEETRKKIIKRSQESKLLEEIRDLLKKDQN
jgi:large conductance mechanosensitive channel